MTLQEWKIFKYLSIAIFAAGIFSAFFSQQSKGRSRAAHWVNSFGFILTWFAGYGMMKATGLKMKEPWILNSIVGSFAAFTLTVWSVGVTKWRPLMGALAATGYAFSIVAMTFRGAPCGSILSITLPLVFGGSFVYLQKLGSGQEEDLVVAQQESLNWFWWIARIEGLSLIVLFGVYMPLKYGAKIVLDGGQGWFGWAHGIFQVVYVAGLISVVRLQKWPITRGVAGFVASLLPLGTFFFEKKFKSESSSE